METASALLFDRYYWILFVMPFAGMFLTLFTKRVKPYRKNGRIYRHDVAARIEHWPHAIGTFLLLISGLIIGLSFFRSFAGWESDNVIPWIDVHFVAACAFLFGTFYYISNAIAEPKRTKEHLPNKHMISSTINHYGSKLGIKKCTYPHECKYFQSDYIAYIYAVGVGAIMAFTGITKALQHVVDLPVEVVSAATFIHDIGTLLMLLFLIAHVFFAVILPWSWKTAPSMIHGWIDEEEAKHEHPAWYEQVINEEKLSNDRACKANTDSKSNE